jgi:hypothetical protein
MINLSEQDKFDGSNKLQDLRNAIGKEYSNNWSSTGRSRLIWVSECGNITHSIEVKSEYNNRKPETGIRKQPSWLTWNSMFF